MNFNITTSIQIGLTFVYFIGIITLKGELVMEGSYKDFIVNHPASLFAGEDVCLLDLLEAKYLYDMFRNFQSSETACFVLEIKEVLSEDVKKILEDKNIKIGDVIYLDFNEDWNSDSRKKAITAEARNNAEKVAFDNDFNKDDRIKRVKEILQFRGCPDYEIGKIDFQKNDGFFVNDSIASKIIGNVYTLPVMVLKPNYKQNENSKQVQIVKNNFKDKKYIMEKELQALNNCLIAVEDYNKKIDKNKDLSIKAKAEIINKESKNDEEQEPCL